MAILSIHASVHLVDARRYDDDTSSRRSMRANLLFRPVRLPRTLGRLWFHALLLASLGPLWLVATSEVFRHVKSGDADFIWWALYLGLPIPLTFWGLIFVLLFGYDAAKAGWESRFLFGLGVIGSSVPLLLLLLCVPSIAAH
jgi:hypothetical protein